MEEEFLRNSEESIATWSRREISWSGNKGWRGPVQEVFGWWGITVWSSAVGSWPHRSCEPPLFHPFSCKFFSLFAFKDFIYLFTRDTERERQRHRQRENQAAQEELNEGLDPRSPES